MNRNQRNTTKTKDIVFPLWIKEDHPVWVKKMDKSRLFAINYAAAIIVSFDKEAKTVKVSYEGDHLNLPIDISAVDLFERSPIPQAADDLVTIEPLNDAELFSSLLQRFKMDDIYCFCGPTLIVTNPYTFIEKYKDPVVKASFREYALKGGKQPSYPHIWNIAARAFFQMFENDKKQAICISGESGAGKTQGTRSCMEFLTSIFKDGSKTNTTTTSLAVSRTGKEDDSVPPDNQEGIETKILACNPIMESFGNSKTIKNDNSSRFGKYFVMFVDKRTKRIKGAQIKNYLLEKSRVITQAIDERNYHIFYQILKFMDRPSLEECCFLDPGETLDMGKFNYLKKSKCFVSKGVNDEEEFQETQSSLNSLKFTQEEQIGLWKTLSCVLNLGNVEVDSSSYNEESPCKLKSGSYLTRICKLLELQENEFSEGFCVKILKTVGNKIKKPRSPNQCKVIIDSLAKDFFNNAFNWLVKKLNKTLEPEHQDDYHTIGLLDIFGFEDFEINSLEQYCINYTNEKLQGLYNSYVFDAEKIIFQEEGLSQYLVLINFEGNKDIVLLLDKKHSPSGIFQLLDETVQLSREGKEYQDGKNFLDKVVQAHAKNKFFFEKRLKRNIFGVKHTAKHVEYNVDEFVAKNKDEFPEDLLSVIMKSNPIIKDIFINKIDGQETQESSEQQGGSGSRRKNHNEKYLGYKFRTEMTNLMDELLQCECNFVRCIKPNEKKQPGFWNPQKVVTQIRYLGILESIKIRREAFPIRLTYKKFYEKFQDLDERSEYRKESFVKLSKKNIDWKKLCLIIKKEVYGEEDNDLLQGKTKVFMSIEAQTSLYKMLEEKQRLKREGLAKLKKVFSVYNRVDEVQKYIERMMKVYHLSKNLLRIWNSKIEYVKFKKFLSVQRRLSKQFKMTKCKRELRLMKFSTTVIARSFQVYQIKDKFFRAKKILMVVNLCVRKIMFKAFLIKARKCRKIVDIIFDKAWKDIRKIELVKSAKSMQRVWRGFVARIGSNEEFLRLRRKLYENLRKRSATCIQKMTRGFIVRQRMDRLNRAAGFIQGYTRMIFLSLDFQVQRRAVTRIAKFYRDKKVKQAIIEERLDSFESSSLVAIQNLSTIEHDLVFRGTECFSELENLDRYTRVKFFETGNDFKSKFPKNHSFVPEVGGSFTLAITNDSKVYSWGLNDYGQLAQPRMHSEWGFAPKQIKPLHKVNPRVISAGDNHVIMVDYNNNAYSWGSNYQGQLGLGHSRQVENLVKLEKFGEKVKNIACRGNQSYIITTDGDIMQWPNINHNLKFKPQIAKLRNRLAKFTNISCGSEFAIAISSVGLLYGRGLNAQGQLGIGNLEAQEKFCILQKLKESGEKVVEVSCGHQHSTARSSSGKMYTWGSSKQGQLGNGSHKNILEPEQVVLEVASGEKMKARSVQAGFSSTYVLLENGKVYQTGSNSRKLRNSNIFRRLFFKKKVFKEGFSPQFIPMKLYSKWSKSLSICFLTIGDFRKTKITRNLKDKQVTKINQVWDKVQNQIYPPFNPTIANYVSPKYLKKIKLSSKNVLKEIPSSKIHRNILKKRKEEMNFDISQEDSIDYANLKTHLLRLENVPPQQWSEEDKMIISLINNKMQCNEGKKQREQQELGILSKQERRVLNILGIFLTKQNPS